jgi:hypothetical protein
MNLWAVRNETEGNKLLVVNRFGSTENAVVFSKLLINLVGAWGFEPQTPTVSR